MLFADLATKGIAFGILVLLTFLLQPSELGKYNALLTAITSLYGMSGLGVGMVLQRESAKHLMQENERISELIPVGLLAMAVTMGFLILIFWIFHDTLSQWVFTGMDSNLIVWIPILAVLYFMVQSPLTLMLGLGQFKLYAYRNLVEVIITGISVLIGGYFWHLQGLMYGLLGSYVINALIVWLMLKRLFLLAQIKLWLRNIGVNASRLLRQGIPYFLGNTFVGAVGNIILVGLFSSHIGYEELGFLRVGLSLSAILLVVPNAAKTVTISFIAKHGQDSTRLKSIQIRYLFSSIVLSTILMISAIVPVVTLLFGDAYMAGIQVYTLVLLIQVFFSMQQILNSFLAGSGQLLFSGLINTIVSLLYIVLAFILIPIMGIKGYYIAFGLSYFLGLVVFIIRDLSGSSYADKPSILTFLLYSLFVLVLTFGIVSFGMFWWTSVLLGVLALFYALACIWFTFNHEEKLWFRQLLERRSILPTR